MISRIMQQSTQGRINNSPWPYAVLLLNLGLGVLIRSEMLPWDLQWVRRWSYVVDEVKALKRKLYTSMKLVRDVLE